MKSGSARSDRHTSGRPLLALTVTLSAQLLVTVALTVPAVLAPEVAPMLGLPAARVGLFVGLCYLCAMSSGLVAGSRIAGIGPVRTSQWAIAAAGLGLVAVAIGGVWMLLPAAIAIGAAYGLTNPAAAIVLGEHAPIERRGLFFSIKQTAVPLGIAVTGVAAPALYALLGWRGAVAALGVACMAGAFALGRTRRDFDRPQPLPPRPAQAWRIVVDPLMAGLRDPALRRLGMVSFAYALTQVCFLTFLVSFLSVEHGFALAIAAGVLAAAQVTSVFSRIFFGYVADRWIAPARLLPLLGVGMAVACILLGRLPADAALAATVAVAMLCALTAVGWNGVFFAELARVAPPGGLAAATGTTQFMTFCGGMTGPVVFSEVINHGSAYGAAFQGLALVPLAAALVGWRAIRGERQAPGPGGG
ncbi:MAG: MFS transporter [Burkholderiaceae bacterium]|nr:MFS transporter [Burkholderiaceae bacterium]